MLLLRDIHAGRRFASARRTVTEGEMMGFAGVTGDFNPVHVDEVRNDRDEVVQEGVDVLVVADR